MNKKNLLIIVAVGVFVVLPVVWWVASLFTQQGMVAVKVIVVPSDATVIIGSSKFSNQTTVKLNPGKYTATVSKDGFQESTQTIFVSEKQTSALIASLVPVSSDAQQWAQNNQDAYTELEQESGEISNQQGLEFSALYPITAQLPIQKSIYSIGYKQVSDDPTKGIIVTIKANEGYREAALQEIRDKGFDPSDYKIDFIDFRSPFNE